MIRIASNGFLPRARNNSPPAIIVSTMASTGVSGLQ